MVTEKELHKFQFLLEQYLSSENSLRKTIKELNTLIKENNIIGITALTEDQAKKIKDLED